MGTALTNKNVVIRKQRQCFSCFRVFPTGTKMNYNSGVYEGDFSAVYSCMTCVEIMNMPQDPDENTFPEGYVAEMLEKGETPEQLIERWKTESEGKKVF